MLNNESIGQFVAGQDDCSAGNIGVDQIGLEEGEYRPNINKVRSQSGPLGHSNHTYKKLYRTRTPIKSYHRRHIILGKKRKLSDEGLFVWGRIDPDDTKKKGKGSHGRNIYATTKTARRRRPSVESNLGAEYTMENHLNEDKGCRNDKSTFRINGCRDRPQLTEDSVCLFDNIKEIGEKIGVIITLNIRGVKRKGKVGWIKEIIRDENQSVLGLQETKCRDISDDWVEELWGSRNFGFVKSDAIGRVGGILMIWDTTEFIGIRAFGDERFVAIKGKWKGMCNLAAITLDRKLSDHCPVVLKDVDLDFGPKPIRAFDVWLEDGEIEEVFKVAWGKHIRSSKPDCVVRDRFKNVKEALKDWSRAKFGDPLGLLDYRPISLIESFYKIIAKLLAQRVKKVVAKVIGEIQNAFIERRSILDGVLIANETMEFLKKSNRKGLIFKEFVMEQGVRQGDPLSPFLFILEAEGLNALMKDAVNNNIFNGVRMGADGVVVSHLQYADETIIFGEWNRENACILMNILMCFEDGGGAENQSS
nr:reverse transcriptase domain, reverse transcriptase zinc-binding domain protein [Tanacetum cinerariifolium]